MVKHKSKILSSWVGISLFFIFAVSNSFGQSKQMTLDDAIKYSLEKNHDTKSALLEIRKAQAAVKEAFGYALPSFTVSANFSHFLQKPKTLFPDFEQMLTSAAFGILESEGVKDGDGNAITNPYAGKGIDNKLQSFAQSNNYEAKAQISQILFNSAVFTGIGASEIYARVSQEQLRSSVLNNVTSIKKAFYGVILSKEMLKILQESLINAEENLKNLQAMNNQGLVSDYQLMQVEVQVENIKPSIRQLENILDNAKNGIKVLIGADPKEDIDFIGELNLNDYNVPDQNELINRTYEANYDIKTLNLKKEVDQAYIDLNKSDYYPSIAAFGSYSYNGSSDDFKFNNYGQALVGLSLEVNLFNGFRTDRKVEQSQVDKLKTEEIIIQLKQALNMQVQTQILEMKRVKTTLEAQERNVKLAEKTYDIATKRFQEGTGTQLEIKNADMELRTAKTNKLQSVYDFISAKVELQKLIGDLEPEYLSYVNSKIDEIIKTK